MEGDPEHPCRIGIMIPKAFITEWVDRVSQPLVIPVEVMIQYFRKEPKIDKL